MFRITVLAACVAFVPLAASAQQTDGHLAAEILKRDNLVDEYCAEEATQALPGFTEEATDDACEIVATEDSD